MNQPGFINLHHIEYIKGLLCCTFAVKRPGSCNILNDTSGRMCVRNKTDDVNLDDVELSLINVMTGINDSKTLTKHYHANVNVYF